MSTEVSMPATTAVQSREESPTVWLWWKETRQLAPLLIMLITVAALIPVIITLVSSTFHWSAFRLPTGVMLLAFPGLFATGAGPLLVGQERALRTIEWLSLLPIGIRRIVRTKLFVSLVGLAVMWLFVLLVTPLLHLSGARDTVAWQLGHQDSYSSSTFSYTFWMVHSVYVLLAGFYVSWRIKNQFHSLLALIPLAFLPMILVGIYYDRPVSSATLEWTTFWVTLVGAAVLLPLGHRAAVRALGPAPAPRVVPLLDAPRDSNVGQSVVAHTPQFGTRMAPLVWQAIHSSRGTFAVLVGVLSVALLSLWIEAWTYELPESDWMKKTGNVSRIGLFLTPLAISWLGVMVFSGDGSASRIRFLADRGVSPGLAYWARHAVPIAILSTGMLFFAVFVITAPWLKPTYADWQEQFPMISFALLAVIVLGIYGISQWVAQLFRTTILNVIMAPIFSAMTAGWFAFVVINYHFPVWAVATMTLLPLLATRIVMRRYMDSSDRPIIFVVAALMIAVIIAIPLLDAYRRVQQVAGMTVQQRETLFEEGRQAYVPDPGTMNVSFYAWVEGTEGDYDENGRMLTVFEKAEREIENEDIDIYQSLERVRQGQRDGMRLGTYVVHNAAGRFMAARHRWSQAEDPVKAFEELQPWIEFLTTVLEITRPQPDIEQQISADEAEILLIDTLQMKQMESLDENQVITKAKSAIGNPGSRAEARRKALLASWYRHVAFGGYFAPNLEVLMKIPPGLSLTSLPDRYREKWVLACLDGIEASRSQSGDTDWLRRVHEIASPDLPFEFSVYAPENRRLPPYRNYRSYLRSIAAYWGRDWEFVTFD